MEITQPHLSMVVKYGVGGRVSLNTNLNAIAVRSNVKLTERRSARSPMGTPCAVQTIKSTTSKANIILNRIDSGSRTMII